MLKYTFMKVPTGRDTYLYIYLQVVVQNCAGTCRLWYLQGLVYIFSGICRFCTSWLRNCFFFKDTCRLWYRLLHIHTCIFMNGQVLLQIGTGGLLTCFYMLLEHILPLMQVNLLKSRYLLTMLTNTIGVKVYAGCRYSETNDSLVLHQVL